MKRSREDGLHVVNDYVTKDLESKTLETTLDKHLASFES